MNTLNLLSAFALSGQDRQELRLATVTGQVDQWLLVQGAGSVEQVRRAASCLIEPQIGDTVLVCSADQGHLGFVLAVLVQVNPHQGQLQLPGGASIEASEGSMKLKGKTLALHSSQAMKLQTPKLNVGASQAQVQIKNAKGWFQSLDIETLRLSTTAKVITTVAKRLLERLEESFRWVDQVDQTHAGRVRTKVEGHFHVQSRHTTMRSEGHVRIDGEKIDLG